MNHDGAEKVAICSGTRIRGLRTIRPGEIRGTTTPVSGRSNPALLGQACVT